MAVTLGCGAGNCCGRRRSGNVTDEMWADYIKKQTAPEPDDNFNVT